MQMAEYSKQQAGVQNEYVLTLVSANAHLEHYYHVELPAIMQVGAQRCCRDTVSHHGHPMGAGLSCGTGAGLAGKFPCLSLWACAVHRLWMGTCTSGYVTT